MKRFEYYVTQHRKEEAEIEALCKVSYSCAANVVPATAARVIFTESLR